MPDPTPTPGRLERFLLQLGPAGELMLLLARGGRWWMAPAALILLLAVGLLLLLQGARHVAPVVYTVF